MKALISVIIPVYNAERYIERCISSILKQTYSNIEIIVIDDGSDDNTINIIKNFEKMNDNLKLFSQKNSGAYVARINGVQKSNGKYIMFVDADDWIDENMVNSLWENSENGTIDYIMCGLIKEKNNKQNINIVPNKKLRGKAIKKGVVSFFLNESISGPYCKLIKRELFSSIDLNSPLNLVLQEDLYLNIKLLDKVRSFVSFSDNYYHYCINENSITQKFIINKFEMTSYVYKCIYNYFDGSIDDQLMNQIKWIYFKNFYAYIIDMHLPTCKIICSDKKKEIQKILSSEVFISNIKNININYLSLKNRLLMRILKTQNTACIYMASKFIYYLKYKLGLKY